MLCYVIFACFVLFCLGNFINRYFRRVKEILTGIDVLDRDLVVNLV